MHAMQATHTSLPVGCSRVTRPRLAKAHASSSFVPGTLQDTKGSNQQPVGEALVRVLKEGEYDDSKSPVGPAFMMPVLGESGDALNDGWFKFGLKRMVKYGPMFRTSVFGMDQVMLCDPELFKALWTEDSKLIYFGLDRGAFYKLQPESTLKGLLNRENSRMPMRRSMVGAMSQEALASYVETIDEISKVCVAELASSPTFPVRDTTRKMAYEVARRVLAGIDLAGEAGQQIVDDLDTYMLGLMGFDFDYPGSSFRKALEARDRTLTALRSCVVAQIEDMRASRVLKEGVKAKKSFLGYVLDYMEKEEPEKLKDVDAIAAASLGVLQAGTDTSASGMSSALTILAARKDIQQRLREEQADILAAYGEVHTKVSLDASKVLDAFVRECILRTPVTSNHYRVPYHDTQLGPYHIKKGTLLAANSMVMSAIQADPNYLAVARAAVAEGKDVPIPPQYHLPTVIENLDMDKWLDPDQTNKPTLLGFGHGPHVCIGMALYFLEAKVLIANIVRRYTLDIAPGHTPAFVDLPLISAKPGVEVCVTPLDKPLIS